MLTVDELKMALPKGLQSNATQEFCDKINAIAGDPDLAREVRENFLTFSKVLTEGKYKTEDYLNAVTYCTFKLMGMTNKDAYAKTFPDRYTDMVAKGYDDKRISAHVAGYHKNQLVNRILEQATIPLWLINQEAVQRAVNRQLFLMENAQSELVQTTAANSLLTHLKQPEVKKVELNLGLKDGGGLDSLRESMATLAERQLELINSGAKAKTIASVPLVGRQEEIIDVVPDPVPRAAPAIPRTLQAANVAQLSDALLHGTGMVRVSADEDGAKVEHVPQKSVSLFATPEPEKEAMELKTSPVNFARCCNGPLEDCCCEETDHIFLPTNEDVPKLPRVSLFDDPAGMP